MQARDTNGQMIKVGRVEGKFSPRYSRKYFWDVTLTDEEARN